MAALQRQKRGAAVGKTKKGKGTKIMGLADRNGLPIALCISSATPHEVTLIDKLLMHRFTSSLPKKMVGDKAYDSDKHDKNLKDHHGIELVAPHRKGRKKPKTQDGRKLRCYKRRWKIERLFAWLQNSRRLLTRFEYKEANFLAFIQLACIRILIRRF